VEEEEFWKQRDPISRFEKFLRARGEADSYFDQVRREGDDLASDLRTRTLALDPPPVDVMFDNIYTDDHPLMTAQKKWLAEYEASFGGGS
jgi:pyruvate dehydrogenase E1 component alpha subunit